MRKQTLLLFLIFTLTLLACEKSDKIEIFLLKKRIESSEGIPIVEHDSFNKTEENLELAKFINIDTITNQWIYGGKFEVNSNDLKENPLICDEEILGINIQKSELVISERAQEKINQLIPNMRHGIQFVICINSIPSLTGYFRSNLSSYIYNWNYISYDYIKHDLRLNTEQNFIIRQNEGYEKWKPYNTDLVKYPELIKALKKTNRIIE